MGIVKRGWNWAMATPARKRWTKIGLGGALALAIPAIWLAWWLGSPLFIDDVANEDFPLTANATIPESVTRSEAESMMETAAKLVSPMTESMTTGMASWRGRLRLAPGVGARRSAGARGHQGRHPRRR